MNIDWNKATEEALARVRYTPDLRALPDIEQEIEVEIFALYKAVANSPLAEHASEILNRLSRIENACYLLGHRTGMKEALPW
jgi:hypothetical protein